MQNLFLNIFQNSTLELIANNTHESYEFEDKRKISMNNRNDNRNNHSPR